MGFLEVKDGKYTPECVAARKKEALEFIEECGHIRTALVGYRNGTVRCTMCGAFSGDKDHIPSRFKAEYTNMIIDREDVTYVDDDIYVLNGAICVMNALGE